MRTRITKHFGNMQVMFEAEDVKAVMETLSDFGEVFCHSKCGACGSENVSPSFRTPKGYKYYSMRCLDCTAEMSFGQRQDDGKLFPKNNGMWSVYQGGNSPPQESQPAPQQQPAASGIRGDEDVPF